MVLSGAIVASLVACGNGSGTGSDIGERRLHFVDELHAYYSSVATCLTDAGIPTEVNAGGDGIERVIQPAGDVLAGQDLDTAFDLCSEQAGGMPDRPPPPTRDELRALYQLNLEVVQCLEDHGLGSVPPPSEEVYVETYLASLSGSQAPWSPYVHTDDGQGHNTCPEPQILDLYQ